MARSAAVADLGGGVHRVTQPLPWALDHVHCYALADADGWTIVDAGLGTPGNRARWAEALAALGHPRIRRIVLTHFHPDHLGGSADLLELTGAEEVLQGALDAEIARETWGGERSGAAIDEYLVAQGMPADVAASSADAEASTPVRAAAPTRLVREGDVVDIAGERWRVLDLPGHADGHIALLGERSGRLLGGDVLLAGITPNVGRWEDGRADPLGDYLRTLRRIEDLAPALVLPGHRDPIADPAGRAAETRAHHDVRLDRTEDALRRGAETAYEVGLELWGDALGLHERRFALVEAVSHLERLERLGRAELAEGRWRAA